MNRRLTAGRRPLAVAAGALGLVVAMAACSSSPASSAGGSASGSANGAAKSGAKTVAFVEGYTADDYYVSEVCGVRAAGTSLHVNTIVDGASTFAPAAQTPVLNAVVQKRPNAIIIDATDAKAMIAPIQDAVNAGIPVMTTGDTIDANLPFTFISANQYQGGQMAADQLAKLLPGGGKVLIIGVEPGITSGDQRQQGFLDELKKYPNLHSLGVQYSNNDQTKAAGIVASTLQAHPDLAGIFAVNLVTAQGTASELRLLHKAGAIKAIGFDAAPQEVTDMQAGLLQALISQNPRMIGEKAVKAVVDHLDGKSVPKNQPSTPVLITPQTVSQPDVKAALYVGSCS